MPTEETQGDGWSMIRACDRPHKDRASMMIRIEDLSRKRIGNDGDSNLSSNKTERKQLSSTVNRNEVSLLTSELKIEE